MHFYKTLLACALLVVSTIAQGPLEFNTFPPNPAAVGVPITVTWSGGTGGPVTITLKKGPSTDLDDVLVLTDSATGGTFTFTLPEDLVDGPDYALEISQGDEVNYTGQFAVTGGTGVSTSSESASSTASSSADTTSSSKSSKTSSSESSETSSASGRNATSSAASTTRAPTGTPTGPTATETSSTTTQAAGKAARASWSSPLALVLGALAAFVYLN